jgi:arylsulfatase A-like enzyme
MLDILPTILDLLGMDANKYNQFQGRSLVPLIQGKRDVKDLPVISGGNRGRVAVILGDWKYYKYETRCKEDRLFCPVRPGANLRTFTYGEQLFHLSVDPQETTDVLQANPAVVAAMRKIAADAMENSGIRVTPEHEIDAETREQLRSVGYLNP